jgi:tetratricopeptide (TPR) repeat protein
MSLKSFFSEQYQQLTAFLMSATETVHCVRIDDELKPLFLKMLAKLEEDPEVPHLFMMCSSRFEDPLTYFRDLLATLSTAREDSAPALAQHGITLAAAPRLDPSLPAPARFVTDASALSDRLPDHIGSLVLVVDPAEVTEPPTYRRSITYLAAEITSPWLKIIVLDPRQQPRLDHIEQDQKRIGVQTFYLSPEETERRVAEDLEGGAALTPVERRQYKGLLAGFAFANKDYDRATRLQGDWVREAEAAGDVSEVANAYYSLGNTYLAQGAFAEAANALCRACDLCVNRKLHALAPFAYTNLGIALHRQGDSEHALESLKVARDMFRAQNQRPGEAYVVDTLAQLYVREGRREEAENAWRYALAIYEGMSSTLYKDLRESGREDIMSKLDRLGAPPLPADPRADAAAG